MLLLFMMNTNIQAENKRSLLITTCGCGGGMYGPNGLYMYLKEKLRGNFDVITCDTVPNKIAPNVKILLDKIYNLDMNLYSNIYLIGWSMGGATVIRTAHLVNNVFKNKSRKISGLVLFSTQLGFTRDIKYLNIPIFFVHGKNDSVLSHEISERLYDNYEYHKMILLIENCCHNYLSIDINVLSSQIIAFIKLIFIM